MRGEEMHERSWNAGKNAERRRESARREKVERGWLAEIRGSRDSS